MGGLFWWLALTVGVTLRLPAGSYLFVWPTLFGLAGVAVRMLAKSPDGPAARVAPYVASAPVLVLLPPTLQSLAAALGPNLPYATAPVAALGVLALVPMLAKIARPLGRLARRPWLDPAKRWRTEGDFTDRRLSTSRRPARVDSASDLGDDVGDDGTSDRGGVVMEPTQELIDAIYRGKVLRARKIPIEQKILSGGQIFEDVCHRMIEGLRWQNPGATDEDLRHLLRFQFRRLRQVRAADVRQ